MESPDTPEIIPSVLVVDDNPLIVNVIRSLLLKENYEVQVANNGQEALRALDHKPVDVIICDVMMPKMDGYQLHYCVREKAELSHIPFVFLTALDQTNEVAKGREVGADDYVTKPFAPEDLLSIVRGKVLRSRGLKESVELRHDDYRKRVIHTLSHEFRTPLVAINTGTEMLLDQVSDGHGNLDATKIQNLLEAISRGGQRLENLVNDFMLLQQIEAGVAKKLFKTRAETTQVSSLLDLLENTVEVQLVKEEFDYKVVDLCEQTKLYVYDVQILDILKRLISNCVKFRSSTNELEVFAYKQENEIVIEIRDRGIGLDPAKIQQAIDAFGQINREKLEQQGGGLGLAIASKYAQINHSHLEFARRKGGGSVVSLIIPVCDK